ncbi:ATP-grasp domain-containing protein [Vibrio harveyi]|uniref:ATP-grasp domain-containing protein n=1 Tax=Vibrio harveyi TaxID=669 RepID=UPI00165E41BD|nr:ATP-grasp domain-containing protein [Vibrio harveyi]
MNVLIVPCGTEIGLEINRSLFAVKGIEVYGANSQGGYCETEFTNLILNIPLITDETFVTEIKKIIQDNNIEVIFPAHDDAALKLKKYENDLDVKVITSSVETNEICRSKSKTYNALKHVIKTPKVYIGKNDVDSYPVFIKPDVGQGSHGAKKITNEEDLAKVDFGKYVVTEYLPGEEYTVDCISDKEGNLLYSSARVRETTKSGISTSSTFVDKVLDFELFAQNINKVLNFKGAWFFQVKKDYDGNLTLLEVATRIAGSMSLSRVNGVNFSELSLYIHNDIDVEILSNGLSYSLERALNVRFKHNIKFESVYVDFDDCIYFNDGVNYRLIGLLYKFINQGKTVNLITRHDGNINLKLNELRIKELFDEVIHIRDHSNKSEHIPSKDAIFIDDSFVERKDVNTNCGIPCFSIDALDFFYE